MAYTDYNGVIERYPVFKDLGSESNVNSAFVYYAEVELNTQFSKYFEVPFEAAHPTIIDLAIDFTYVKYLRSRDPELAEKLEESLNKRVKSINEGDAFIYTGSGTTIARTRTGGARIWSSTEDYVPTFSMLDTEDPATHVDSNYLADLENERK